MINLSIRMYKSFYNFVLLLKTEEEFEEIAKSFKEPVKEIIDKFK